MLRFVDGPHEVRAPRRVANGGWAVRWTVDPARCDAALAERGDGAVMAGPTIMRHGTLRTAGLVGVGCVVLALVALGGLPAPAEAGEGDQRSAPAEAADRQGRAALVVDRLEEAAAASTFGSDAAEPRAEQRLPRLAAGLDGALVPQSDEICAERTWDHPGGTSRWIDVGAFGAHYYCDGAMVLGIMTYDEWYASDLEAVIWWIDTTGSERDGCDGDNAAVVVAGGSRLEAGVIALPSCDPDSWAPAGGAVASRNGALDFLGVVFDHAALGNPPSIHFFGGATNVITDDLEAFPVSGRASLRGLESEPEPAPEPEPEPAPEPEPEPAPEPEPEPEPVPAPSAPSTDLACPPGDVPSAGFGDIAGSAHAEDIDCLAWWEITRGVSATEYGPRVEVTRAQMAAMLDRMLRATDDHPGPADPARFDDTAGHAFADEVAVLADLGVVNGLTADTFGPDRPVTRAQMASMLVRLADAGYGANLPDGDVPFTDITADSAHYDDVGRLVAAGITTGTGARSFSPHREVSRAQMASFLMRTANELIDQGLAEAPSGDAGGPSLSIDPGCVEVGGDFVVTATGLEPGGAYDVRIDPLPGELFEAGATMTADDAGVVELPGGLPPGSDVTTGDYTWSVAPAGSADVLAESDFTIADACR